MKNHETWQRWQNAQHRAETLRRSPLRAFIFASLATVLAVAGVTFIVVDESTVHRVNVTLIVLTALMIAVAAFQWRRYGRNKKDQEST